MLINFFIRSKHSIGATISSSTIAPPVREAGERFYVVRVGSSGMSAVAPALALEPLLGRLRERFVQTVPTRNRSLLEELEPGFPHTMTTYLFSCHTVFELYEVTGAKVNSNNLQLGD